MTTATPSYGAAATLTCTSSGLASSSLLTVGRQSTVADNTSDLADDSMVGGKLVTSATTTTNTQIQIWAFGTYDGTTYSASAGATDAGFTPDTGAKNLMKLLTIIPNITTTAVTYAWGPFSVAQAFGGTMPSKWGIWIVHNVGTPLAAGSEIKYTPVKYASA